MALTRPSFNQINSTVTALNDPLTVINKSATSASQDLGFVFNRDGGATANVAIYWDETNNRFNLVNTTSSGATNSNVAISSYANLNIHTLDALGSITTAKVDITNTTTDDSILITTTEDSSTAGPVLTLKRNSSSPSNGDYLGQIKFKGENDADQEVVYSKITGKVLDASDGTEDGILEFAFKKGGSNNISARFRSDSLQLLNGTTLTVNGLISTDSTITATSDIETTGGDVNIKARGETRFYDSDSSNYVALRAGSTVASDVTFTLPTEDGDADQVLSTDGAGTLSFVSAGAGGGSAYGNTQVGTFLETYNGVLLAVTTANIGQIGYTDNKVTTANIGQIGYTDNKVTTANIGQIGYTDNKVTTANIGQIGFTNETVTQANVGLKGYTDSQLGSKAPLASPSFTTKITTPDIDKSGTNGSGDIGQTDNRFGTIYGLATSAQYADLAEKYTTDQEYSPGTVMSFGGTHEITQCVKSHDRKVAGVISTDPAYMMNSTAEGQYLALQGRVPCKVIGPIEKGELVVTSATPGVAQKLDDAQYQPGCVIGKSLETITDNSIQPIEVVVGRL
jgi:hypothetical protein